MTETVKCVWCAEEIQAEAKKCKHCGEFLTDERPAGPVVATEVEQPRVFVCEICGETLPTARERSYHRLNRHKAPPGSSGKPYTGKMGERQRLSAVGVKGDAGLACPKCGNTQFTAKRSNKGKVIGFTTLGVAGLVAPKSQVKCVSCGMKFKRG